MNGKPKDVLERVVRQLLQVYGPVLALVLTAPGAGSDIKATALALATAALFTTLKLAAGLRSEPGDPVWKVILDRAGSAAAGVIAGAGVTDLVGLLSLDWSEVFGAAGVAAAIALLMYYMAPPANPPSPAPAGPDGAYNITDAPASRGIGDPGVSPVDQLRSSRDERGDRGY